MHSKKKLVIGTALAIAISAAATIYVFWHLPAEAGDIFPLPFPSKQLALAMALLILAWLADSLRLRILTRAIDREITYATALRAIWSGNFLTLITPFLFGGTPAVIYVLKEAGLTWLEAGAVVTVGGWLSQMVLVGLSLVAVLGLQNLGVPFPWHNAFLTGVLLYLAALLGLLVLLIQPKLANQIVNLLPSGIRNKAEKALHQFYCDLTTLLARSPVLLLLAMGASTAYFICLFSIAPILLASSFPQFTARVWLYLQNVAYIGPLFAPTPGASGASELWQLAVFDPVLPATMARQYLLMWRLLTFYLNILVGGIAFIFSSWRLFVGTVHPRHR
ncbi:MAG: flippase-like domain-containing protein [Firmicutes bacterium]|nr:flippase-like domain-containing protein [Bacillota bacterium]